MSFVRRLAGAPVQERAHYEQLEPNWLHQLFGKSAAGKTVTVETAMQLDAVVGCVRLVSETVGAFPLKTYEERDEGEVRREVRKHPTYELLHRRPNPEHPPVTFWGLAATHLLTWGDAFIGKSFGRGNRVERLWTVHPQRVEVKRENGRKLFIVDGDYEQPYTSDEIIHVLGFTLDGMRGLSPIGMAREAIGAGLAIDEYTNRFFSNSALPIGVLETDQTLSDDAQKRVRRDWERRHKGVRNAAKVAILEEGLKFHALSLPLKDLEFVALQNLSARKIARIFRVPASMIDADADSGKSLTYRTVENDNLQFLIHTIRPWLKRIAQSLALDQDLFPPGSGLMCEHVVDDLLLTDAKSQNEAYATATGGKPWMRPSEVRRKKNMPPDPELDKDPEPAALPAPAPAPEPERQQIIVVNAGEAGGGSSELAAAIRESARIAAVTRELPPPPVVHVELEPRHERHEHEHVTHEHHAHNTTNTVDVDAIREAVRGELVQAAQNRSISTERDERGLIRCYRVHENGQLVRQIEVERNDDGQAVGYREAPISPADA